MQKKYRMMKNTLLAVLLFFLCAIPSLGSYAAEKDSSFWVEYIDVGQGDSALIQCDGHYMMIDGGPSDASSIVYTILKNKEIKNIDLMVATHPDADHIGGLSGALNYSKVNTVLSPVKAHDTKTFKSFEKYVTKQGKTFTMPVYGDKYELGSAEVEILGPIYDNAESNNLSIVVKVTYGDNTFIFMGDAEEEEEGDILRRNRQLNCDVLKIGHHGSKSSTSNALLKATNPKYAVISVGSGNSYGHPTQETIDKLTKANVEIYRTDLQGDIIVSSDGKELTISTEKNASSKDVTTGGGKKKGTSSIGNDVAIPANTTFVLNTNSKKFHYPECDSVSKMSAKNMQFSTDTADAIVALGFVPCKVCNPYTGVVPKTSETKKEQTVEQKPQVEQQTQVEQPSSTGSAYVLNTNSKKFHYPNCSSVGKMSAKNRADVTSSRDEIIAQGYAPCKNCNP